MLTDDQYKEAIIGALEYFIGDLRSVIDDLGSAPTNPDRSDGMYYEACANGVPVYRITIERNPDNAS